MIKGGIICFYFVDDIWEEDSIAYQQEIEQILFAAVVSRIRWSLIIANEAAANRILREQCDGWRMTNLIYNPGFYCQVQPLLA